MDPQTRASKLSGQEVESAWLRRLQAGGIGHPFVQLASLISLVFTVAIGLLTSFFWSVMLICLAISLIYVAYSSWADRIWRQWKNTQKRGQKAWESAMVSLTIGQLCSTMFMLTLLTAWDAAIHFLKRSEPILSTQILVAGSLVALFGISGGLILLNGSYFNQALFFHMFPRTEVQGRPALRILPILITIQALAPLAGIILGYLLPNIQSGDIIFAVILLMCGLLFFVFGMTALYQLIIYLRYRKVGQ